jgi:N-methylhydantoinase B
MKALAQAVPDKVVACGFDTTTVGVLSHLDKESGWSVYQEIFGGGYGAAADTDGCDAVDNPLANCANTPVEALDQDFPFFRVLEYSLRPDSCGRGKCRGGLGFLRRYEILKDGVRLSFFSDRFRRSADGLFGGEPGATGYLQVARGGKTFDLKSKATFDLLKGDIVTLALGGGGGYGPAAERLEQQINDDVDDGLISGAVAAAWKRVG